MRSKRVLNKNNKNTNLDLRTQTQRFKKKNLQTAIQDRVLHKRSNHISINEAIKSNNLKIKITNPMKSGEIAKCPTFHMGKG